MLTFTIDFLFHKDRGERTLPTYLQFVKEVEQKKEPNKNFSSKVQTVESEMCLDVTRMRRRNREVLCFMRTWMFWFQEN